MSKIISTSTDEETGDLLIETRERDGRVCRTVITESVLFSELETRAFDLYGQSYHDLSAAQMERIDDLVYSAARWV